MSDLTKEMGFRGDVARLLASNGKAVHLDNPNRKCAAEAIRQMIASAKESICIYCHRLANDIYDADDVVKALSCAYRRNPNLKVTLFLRACQPSYNRFYNILLLHKARVAKDMTDRIVSENNAEMKDIPDFFDVDNKSIRLEVSEEYRSATIYQNDAIVSERVAKYAKSLEKLVLKNMEAHA